MWDGPCRISVGRDRRRNPLDLRNSRINAQGTESTGYVWEWTSAKEERGCGSRKRMLLSHPGEAPRTEAFIHRLSVQVARVPSISSRKADLSFPALQAPASPCCSGVPPPEEGGRGVEQRRKRGSHYTLSHSFTQQLWTGLSTYYVLNHGILGSSICPPVVPFPLMDSTALHLPLITSVLQV